MAQTERGKQNSLGASWQWTTPGKSGVLAGGLQCYNGPKRSTKIEFRCGVEDLLVSIEESERCVYSAVFTTPAACVL